MYSSRIKYSLCMICSDIDLAAVSQRQSYDPSIDHVLARLGSLENVTKSAHDLRCTICQLVLPFLELDAQDVEYYARFETFRPDPRQGGCQLREGYFEPGSSRRHLQIWYGRFVGDVEIVTQENWRDVIRQQHEVTTKKVNLETLNEQLQVSEQRLSFATVRNWLSDCEQSHGSTCPHTKIPAGVLPANGDFILIDVGQQCLVNVKNLPETPRYIALSYVSDSMSQLIVNKSNSNEFLRPGALFSSHISLPKTFIDAMTFVSEIGERFLWIDALCTKPVIPSQNPQPVFMTHHVYRNAFATIVALDSANADNGLPGIRPYSRSPQPLSKVGDTWLTTSSPKHLSWYALNTTYESRAETMQERVLSTHCIYFTKTQVISQCPSSTQNEIGRSTTKSPTTGLYTDALRSLILHQEKLSRTLRSNWKCVSTYMDLVQEYTKRNIADQDTVLDTFCGLSFVIENYCGGGVFAGLPGSFIDLALLWVPQDKLKRCLDDVKTGFPAWSWAGWIGKVRYPTIMEIHPLSTTGGTFNNSEISNVCLEDENGTKYFLTPQAWRERDEFSDGLLSDSRIPSDRRQHNGNILDLRGGIVAFDTNIVSSSQFSSASLYKCPFATSNGVEVPTFLLLNESGHHCGLLYGHQEPPSTWQQKSSSEFALISTKGYTEQDWGQHGECNLKYYDKKHFGQQDNRQVATFLIVAWSGELAERLGVGQMLMDAWDAAGPRARSVRLV